MAHHVSALAKADLEDIWEYLYNQSGGNEVADRQIDAITHRFYLLSRRPQRAVERGPRSSECRFARGHIRPR
jgi:plasmid stabilization system protein ParE